MKLRNKKTGEIIETHLLVVQSAEDPTKRYYTGSIKDLCDNYEDYKLAEPLIKDDKVRKAVRAWAEANDYGNDEVYEFEDFCTSWRSWSLEHRGDDNEIHFNGGIDFDKMNHRGTYTIAELCGEEEE